MKFRLVIKPEVGEKNSNYMLLQNCEQGIEKAQRLKH